MLSLEEYEKIAKLCLIKRGVKITDELLGEVIHAIALADTRHHGDNLTGFRSSYIDYMFKTLSTKRKKYKNTTISLDDIGYYDNNTNEFWDFVQSKLPDLKYNIIYDKFKNGLSIKDLSIKYNLKRSSISWIIKKSLERLKLCSF